jgi:hypothetical protein|tara:strand:+ start:1397 stop:1561 length:165 start_codon:yes stop_codon:yes gene_type:complete
MVEDINTMKLYRQVEWLFNEPRDLGIDDQDAAQVSGDHMKTMELQSNLNHTTET